MTVIPFPIASRIVLRSRPSAVAIKRKEMGMSLKLKAIGLSLVALTALGAFVAMNASAETGGHFTSDATTGSTIFKGTQSGTHTTELTVPGLTGIVCEEASYEGTATGATVESVTIVPKLAKCKTTGGTTGELTVDMNGCQGQSTIGKNSTADNTVDIVCPGATKFAAITHPACEIRMPAQNNIVGVAYNTVVENSKHALTVVATAKGFTIHFESGFCVLLGTKQTAEVTGSVTVQGFNDNSGTAGSQVNVTATGSEG